MFNFRKINFFDFFNKGKKYKLVSSIGYNQKGKREIAKDWDKVLNIPYELGMYLQNLINNQDSEKYYIGVHSSSVVNDRNSSNYEEVMNNEIIYNIFNDGLINNGNLSSGVSNQYEYNDIYNTVSRVKDMFHLVLEIKSKYKGSRGGFILKFPKEYVDENLNIKEGLGFMIYDIKNKLQYIKPEFIIGYVGIDKYDKFTWYPKEMFIKKEKNKL